MDFRKFDKKRTSASSRVLARLLDYCFFYSFVLLPLFYTILLENDFYHLIALFLLPFFWIFFEAILIALFGTTPGKALLGIHIRTEEGKKPSLKTSFKRAFLIWQKVLGGNIPFLHIALPIYTLRKQRKEENLSWDKSLNLIVYTKKRKVLRRAFSYALIATFFFTFIAEFNLREVMISSEQGFLTGKVFKEKKGKWLPYEDPEGSYKVAFLAKPVEFKTSFPIPKSKDTLPYTEIKQESKDKAVTYVLSYTTLPKSWLRFSSGILLRGALKVFTSQTPHTKIMKKSSRKYRHFPSLEFLLQKGKSLETCGILVLVGKNLYKLDVTYPSNKREEMEESMQIFLNSFEPKAS